MPMFVSLINWTEKGIGAFKDTVDRSEKVTALAEKMGGKITDIYWTVGQYDIVTIGEFPDDETATAFLLQLGAQGNVRTTSLRAFNAEEMRRIVGKAG
jgi:uncharacterized protein with GYD domain